MSGLLVPASPEPWLVARGQQVFHEFCWADQRHQVKSSRGSPGPRRPARVTSRESLTLASHLFQGNLHIHVVQVMGKSKKGNQQSSERDAAPVGGWEGSEGWSNGHCRTEQKASLRALGPSAATRHRFGPTVRPTAALSIKFFARTWKNRKEAALPRVSSGNFPEGKRVSRDLVTFRPPTRSWAGAIARFGGRRRSCRRQPPHSDGGRAGPAAAAAPALAGHDSGGGSGGRRGPVTGSRPGPGHHEPRPPPRGEQRARGEGPPYQAALPVSGRGVRAAAGGSGRRGGGTAAGGDGVRWEREGAAGRQAGSARWRAGAEGGGRRAAGRRGAHVEEGLGRDPEAGPELCRPRR